MTNVANNDNEVIELNESLEEAIVYSKKYIEDVISFFGLNIDIYATSNDNEVIELNVPSTHLNGFLIGQKGDTMHAMQQIISSALRNQHFKFSRVVVDVADYKKQRADRLAEKVVEWINKVKESKEDYKVRPMNATDRRVVHKVASEHNLETESFGEGRDRHVVIKAANTDTDKASD